MRIGLYISIAMVSLLGHSLMVRPASAANANINGDWTGVATQPGGSTSTWDIELSFTQSSDGKITGTRTIKMPGQPQYYGILAFRGTVSGAKVTLTETGILSQNPPPGRRWCVISATLTYSTPGSLIGPWNAPGCSPGEIRVTAKNTLGPCGDERDKIIAEYTTRYNGKLAGYKPSCNEFTRKKGSITYNFNALNKGDGTCSAYTWALISPPLVAPPEAKFGVDRFIQEIFLASDDDELKIPALNSGYRSPKRHFKCVGASAKNSAHLYGGAVDLDVVGSDSAREAIAQKWNKIAKSSLVQARFVESKKGFECSYLNDTVPLSRRWQCVHADWQRRNVYIHNGYVYNAIGIDTGDVPFSTKSSPSSLSPYASDPNIADGVQGSSHGAAIERTLQSANWRDRAELFHSLGLDLSLAAFPLHAEPDIMPMSMDINDVDGKTRGIINRLLEKEVDSVDTADAEERAEYLLSLAQAAGLYGGEAAVASLMDKRIVEMGTVAYEAAARTGDKGVGRLVELYMNGRTTDDYSYDLLRVACTMRKLNTVRDKGNLNRVDDIIIRATFHRDQIHRGEATTCLGLLPVEKRSYRLKQLLTDSSRYVRSHAGEALMPRIEK